MHLVGNDKKCSETEGVWFGYWNTGEETKMYMCITDQGKFVPEGKTCLTTTHRYVLNRWVDVKITQQTVSKGYIYSVFINGVMKLNVLNPGLENHDAVKVYTANPWWKVKNFSVDVCAKKN